MTPFLLLASGIEYFGVGFFFLALTLRNQDPKEALMAGNNLNLSLTVSVITVASYPMFGRGTSLSVASLSFIRDPRFAELSFLFS